MNKQAKFDLNGHLTTRGIEWTHLFGLKSGFTENPVRGCRHRCKWRMPDGKIVECYAESFRGRLDGKGAFQNITFHPEVFTKIRARKEPAGVFIDSASDLMGNGVEEEWIMRTLEIMAECEQHVFFVLTKNPRRLTCFEWPDNVLVGMSAPPTFMFGNEMTPEQQRTWFRKGMDWLADAKAKLKWVSLEPLAADVVETLVQHQTGLDWAVIGAGSDGRRHYQPDEKLLADTLHALTCPVFFKGNLDRALAERNGGWREEWPKIQSKNV